jgi:spore germination protein
MKQTPDETLNLQHILSQFDNCADLNHRTYPEIHTDIIYFQYLVDINLFTSFIIEPFAKVQLHELEGLLKQSMFVEVTHSKDAVLGIMDGNTAVFHGGKVYLVDVYGPKGRDVQPSQTETVIVGPHEAFVEDAGTNLSLIRRRLHSSHLKIIKCSVGEVAKSDVYVLYIEGIANVDFVNEVIHRIKGIEYDTITDGGMLSQIFDDDHFSIFPQFLTTERPDVAVSKLNCGRILTMVDSSPTVISAPTGFFEFFSSPDDYYERWALGTALRLLRILALTIALTFTALYVSVTTFHYEMIPESLLRTLVESRSRVPFPPVYEALLMETMIELLREAGARLPTKIGQTIGIVGGIVIGQAAVQAGLTSNVLIIAVASSAIASFVIPSYVMSGSIRLIRFGLIISAGIWGNLGLVMAVALVIIHMSGLTSLGSSYVAPLAPMRFRDWKDIFIRAPFAMMRTRSFQTKTPNPVRQKIRK